MEQTSEHAVPTPRDTSADSAGKFINLRPFLRWRLGIAVVALAAALFGLVSLTFGGGSVMPAPTDPDEARAAWAELVDAKLETNRPACESMELPTVPATDSSPPGLLRARALASP